MRHLTAAGLLYAALLAHVGLRYGFEWRLAPNLILLAGLWAAGRGAGGATVWAAAAGLTCDALAGRPLGVTMLAATLAATVGTYLRNGRPPVTHTGRAVAVFLSVAAIESSARVLSGLDIDRSRDLTAAGQIAFLTAAVAFSLSAASAGSRAAARVAARVWADAAWRAGT